MLGAPLRAAPYETPYPARRSKPAIGNCLHATPQARMSVRARRTSPPSRCNWRVAVSMRETERVTRISAPSRRACCSARLGARHPTRPREAEIVLDPGGGARLTPRRLSLDHDRVQALRCAVHGRGQARRARAHDHGVVLRGGGLGAQAEQLGHAAGLRLDHGLAVDDLDRGQVRLGR